MATGAPGSVLHAQLERLDVAAPDGGVVADTHHRDAGRLQRVSLRRLRARRREEQEHGVLRGKIGDLRLGLGRVAGGVLDVELDGVAVDAALGVDVIAPGLDHRRVRCAVAGGWSGLRRPCRRSGSAICRPSLLARLSRPRCLRGPRWSPCWPRLFRCRLGRLGGCSLGGLGGTGRCGCCCSCRGCGRGRCRRSRRVGLAVAAACAGDERQPDHTCGDATESPRQGLVLHEDPPLS